MGMDFQDGDENLGTPQMPQGALPRPQSAENFHSARAPEAYCLRRAQTLLASYGENRVGNPEVYSASIAAVLSEYRQAVVDVATDPRTGIQNETDKPPTVKQLRRFCEAEAARQWQAYQRDNRPKPNFNRTFVPPPDIPGRRANLFVGTDSAGYAEALAYVQSPHADQYDWKYGVLRDRSGIWINQFVFERLKGGRHKIGAWQSPNDDRLRESLARLAGRKPAEAL